MPTGSVSYDVRVWSPRKYKGSRGTTHNVRWRVGHKSQRRTFATAKAAETFRAELLSAHRNGEQFDIQSGLPRSMQAALREISWLEHACEFVDSKWRQSSARHEKE